MPITRYALVIALALGAGFVGGNFQAQPVPVQNDQDTVVRASKFLLIDGEGKTRAELTLASRGTTGGPGLLLYDREGKPRAEFSLWPGSLLGSEAKSDGFLAFNNKAGLTQASIFVDERDSRIALNGRNSQALLSAGTFAGSPKFQVPDRQYAYVSVSNDDGLSAQMSVGSSDRGAISLTSKGRPVARVTTDFEDTGSIELLKNKENQPPKVIWTAPN